MHVERGLTPEQMNLSKPALGSYEAMPLSRIYGVAADQLLGLSEVKPPARTLRLIESWQVSRRGQGGVETACGRIGLAKNPNSQ